MSDIKKIDISDAMSELDSAVQNAQNSYQSIASRNSTETDIEVLDEDKVFFEELLDDANVLKNDVLSSLADACVTTITTVDSVLGKYEWYNDFVEFSNEKIVPLQNKVKEIEKRTGATIGTFFTSIGEGIVNLGEGLVDLVGIVGTGILSVPTGIIDGVQAIGGAVTGEDWDSVTKKMWNGTKGFVSEDYSTALFDLFYDGTKIGQFLKNNSYGFDTTRGIGSGLGKVAGIVGISVASGGTLAAFGRAAMSGFGEGAETSWKEGASIGEGLLSATLNSAWEGLQYFVGGKIGSSTLFGKGGKFLNNLSNSAIKTNILNSTSRVLLDGLDGGVEGFVQPLIASIYKDGYYDEDGNYIEFKDCDNFLDKYGEIFDDYGGVKNVFTNAVIGSGASILGEVFDIGRFFNKSSSETHTDIDSFLGVNENGVVDNVNPISDILNKLNEEDIDALMASADISDYYRTWSPQSLRDTFHNVLDRKFGYGYVDAIIDRINNIKDSDWQTLLKAHNLNSNIVGFVDRIGNLFLPQSASKHTATHEGLHKFSEWRNLSYTDIYGKKHKATGIKQYYTDGRVTNIANETLTEYLASKIDDGKFYSSMYDSSGNPIGRLWEQLDNAFYEKWGSNNILLDCYLDNDVNTLRSIFNENAYNGAWDNFVLELEKSYAANIDYLKDIINSVTTSLNPKGITGLIAKIIAIFGG